MLFPKEGLQFQGILLLISSIVPLQKEDEDTLLAPILVVKETGDNEEPAPTQSPEDASAPVPIDGQSALTEDAEYTLTPVLNDPDDEKPSPIVAPIEGSVIVHTQNQFPKQTVHDEEHPPTEATESASKSVTIDSVDDEQPDLTKTAENAPTPIPKDPFTVIIEDASTLEVEEVFMLSVVSIGV